MMNLLKKEQQRIDDLMTDIPRLKPLSILLAWGLFVVGIFSGMFYQIAFFGMVAGFASQRANGSWKPLVANAILFAVQLLVYEWLVSYTGYRPF